MNAGCLHVEGSTLLEVVETLLCRWRLIDRADGDKLLNQSLPAF